MEPSTQSSDQINPSYDPQNQGINPNPQQVQPNVYPASVSPDPMPVNNLQQQVYGAEPNAPSNSMPINNSKSKSFFKTIFTGRLNRREFFNGQFLTIVPLVGAYFILDLLVARSNSTILAGVLSYIFIAFLLLAEFSLSVRRCHDLGKSGLYSLLSFVPVLDFIVALVLFFAPGNAQVNQFGERSKVAVDIKRIYGLKS